MEPGYTEEPVQSPPQNEARSIEPEDSSHGNLPDSVGEKSDHQESNLSSVPSEEKEPETELVKYVFKDASRPDDINGAVAVVQKVECVPPLAAEVATLEDIGQPPQASTSTNAHGQSVEGETATFDGTADKSDMSATVLQTPLNSKEESHDAADVEKTTYAIGHDEPTVTSPQADIRLQSAPSVCLKVDIDQSIKATIPAGPVLLLSGEQIEETVDQHLEHATLQNTLHDATDQAEKPTGLEITPGVVVEGAEMKVQSDLKIASMGSLEKVGKKPKRKSRLPFKFKRSKPTGEQGPRSEGSLDRSSLKSFGENVRSIFGTVRSSVKRKHKPAKQETKPTSVRPPRPPALNGSEVKTRPASNDLDAHSLRSVSGPSITDSPIVPRRRLVQQTLPDLMAALPSDSAELHIQVNGHEASETNELSQEPNTHERELSPGREIVHEENIQPVSVRRYVPLSEKSDADQMPEGTRVSPAPTGGSTSPKPPRPHYRPALSPLDYQPYEPSLDGSCEPMEVSVHRVNLVRATSQGGFDGRDTHHQIDYADRIRERVKSLRAEPSEETDASSTLGTRKGRTVKETYVCSDTVKWPKIHLKLKKKLSSASKDTPRSVYEPAVHRPQPRITPYYQANSLHRPPPPPSVANDQITVSRVDYVQSSFPPVARMNNGPMTKHSDSYGTPQSGRQLTSLLSVSVGAQPHQHSTLAEFSQKDRVQVNSPSPSQDEHSTVPYFSAELAGDATMKDPRNLCTENGTDHTTSAIQQERVNETIKRLQPFLDAWETLKAEDDQNTQPQHQIKISIQEFFNTCIRLRSADLQGHFSPFHYPLPSFKEYYWIRCAKLRDWDDLQIMREPEWNTEYALLPCCGEGKLLFADRPVDILLTNWLDCRHASPPVSEHYENVKLQMPTNPIFHPVQMVITLEQLLKSEPYEEETKNELFHTALRLAVLLAFEYCCASNPKPNPRVEDILIILSPINCLALFRQCLAQESDEDQRGNFVRELYTSCTSSSDAIDALIDQMHSIVTSRLNMTYTAPSLLKAVAPPNWIAQLIARTCLKKMSMEE